MVYKGSAFSVEPEVILKTVELSKEFRGNKAVDSVSMSVYKGETLAIIGPNGAGKSTLFNTITGEKEVSAGSIFFEKANITKLSGAKRMRLGIGRTFQITSVFAGMTAQENVQLALMVSHGAEYDFFRSAKVRFREEAKELIDLVSLYKEKDQIAGSLSHGDQRLLELAISLASRPRLLMLDEPTQGLSPGDRTLMMTRITEVGRAKNLTVVFVEHDMDVVFSVASRLIVMHHGKILADGVPSDVRENKDVIQVYLGDSLEAETKSE